MEIWILGLGALVLIAITVWIVWPARTTDSTGSSARAQEVPTPAMSDTLSSAIPPQGDRFEDQYTSATADLSAGGIATTTAGASASPGAAMPAAATGTGDQASTPHSVPTQGPVNQTRGQPWPEADAASAHIGQPSRVEAFPYEVVHGEQPAGGALAPRRLGIGAASVLALGGAVGGAWVYARWQRERNRPINRFRRRARGMAQQVSDRISDVDFDDLPVGRAPMSGAASALLLAALVGSARALRRDDSPTDLPVDSGDMRRALDRGREQSRRALDRLPTERMLAVDTARPTLFGLSAGSLAVVAGCALVIWRLLRRSAPQTPYTWYAGQ